MGAMRKFFAWLGAATLFVLMSSRADAANDVLKPYVVLILDTSGSMLITTGSGPTSCGKPDNRLNHAVCAINNIVNSYGDMVFSLGRFRESTNGGNGPLTCDANGNQDGNESNSLPVPSGGDVCNTQGAYCGDCNPTTGQDRACYFCNNSGDCPAGYSCDSALHKSCFKFCGTDADCTAAGDACLGGVCRNRCSGPDSCSQATSRCTEIGRAS